MKKQFELTAWSLGLCALVGCNGVEENIASEKSLRTQSFALVTNCKYTTPAIDREAELIIRHVNVVDDPCRTKPNGTGCTTSSSQGKWSFGYLVSQMAGDNSPSEFVLRWLGSFETSRTVNGFAMQARGGLDASNLPVGVTAKVVQPWRQASGCSKTGSFSDCTLDFTKAPFRLLAIVNRIDLAGPVDFYGSSGPNSGEARFVFGVTDTNGAPLEATVIFEYKLPSSRTTFDWATQWHNLVSAGPVGSPAYNNALEQLTNQITVRGAISGAPNNSAISQVRTNEIAFDLGKIANQKVWELREQRLLDCSAGSTKCWLIPDTVKQTPDHTKNMTAALDTFFVNNTAKLAAETHVVPTNLLTGAARSKAALNTAVVWDLLNQDLYNQDMGGSGPITSVMRYNFALATCTGCHYVETNTSNMHISNRVPGQMSQFSNFLAVSIEPSTTDARLPANSQSFFDSVSNESRTLNEPWRRACEMKRLLNGDPNPWTKTSGAH
ncbi:hypothetical protein [Archangium violaceum]|uniref:hypothetical protein n=1 Tax=Archangium violaceum TaxID=83451 RepID=UPI0036D7C963